MTSLHNEISACRVCAAYLPHGPRPVVQFAQSARLAVIGQAPGSKVHASGIPWDDASGDRLCDWTGLSREELHDPACVAIVPMGFCYPGKGSSGDLPPRKECAPLWHPRIWAEMPHIRLTLLVGTYAQAAYLPETKGQRMADRVAQFRQFSPRYFPLPHPSWRSTMFMRANSWFETDVLPELRKAVAQALG